MKLFNIAILALLLVTFCEAQENSNEGENFTRRNYCTSKTELIGGGNNIPKINLNLNQTSEKIYNQIKRSFEYSDSSCFYTFKIPYNTNTESIDSSEGNIEFKVSVYKAHGSTSCLRNRRSDLFLILVNKWNQMLVQQRHETDDFQYITNNLPAFYEGASQDFKKYIHIQWDDDCSKKELEKVFHASIDGYLNAAAKYSEELFSKELCELSSYELAKLKEFVPFNLVFYLKGFTPTPQAPPPPPPSPKE